MADKEERFFVMAPGMWENDASTALPDWWAVVDEDAGGIVAYAGTKKNAVTIRDALRKREGVR